MCILLNLRSSADSIPSALTIFKPAYLPHPMRTQEPVDDSCVFAQKSQQQVLRLYVRVNVLKVVKMFLQSMEIVFLCMLQQEVQGTLASITIERRTGRVTGRRGAERAKTVLTVLSEAVSALCRLRPLPPRLSRVEPGRWQNACSVLIDRKRPSKSALSRCSDSIRRTP
jgi:hypothetical protein